MTRSADRMPKAVERLLSARDTLAEMGEPYFGGSVIGGSRASHAESGRHPDPKGAPWRRRVDYLDQLINDLAHRAEKMVGNEERVASWKCTCGYPRWQGPGVRFCAKCGKPKPVGDSEDQSRNTHRKSGEIRA